jgi:hypothetical protein
MLQKISCISILVFLTVFIIFFIAGSMGDKSVEDVYKEAELREKGTEDGLQVTQQPPEDDPLGPGPGGAGPMDTGPGQHVEDPGLEDAASRALKDRCKKFLEAHRNKNNKNSDCVTVNCTDSAQNGIKNLRIKNLGAQLFDTGTAKISLDLEGFRLHSEAWGEPFF